MTYAYDPNYIAPKTYVLVGQKAVIFNAKSQLLLLKRSEKSGNGGKWSLAGGALEADETPLEGLQREIKEETGLEVTGVKPLHVFSDQNKENELVIMLAYSCFAKTENVTLNWEHDDFKWVTKDEALEMDLSEHARIIIDEFK